MSEAHLFVIGILLAWMAGIRVYLTVFGLGLAGALGWLDLPPALQVTESWWVLGASGALALTEFFADKIPGRGFGLGPAADPGAGAGRRFPGRGHPVARRPAGRRRPGRRRGRGA